VIVETPDVEILRRRRGRKWSRYPADVLPAWIADMDFLPAPAIRDTLIEAIDAGDLGYAAPAESTGLPESFARWALRRWQWRVDPCAVLVMPDVVGGIANCIEALTEPGDAILVQTPIYPPFLSCVRNGGRKLITSALVGTEIDFDDIESAIVQHGVRLIMLCNPHNPSGRCFTTRELSRLAALAIEHGALVMSDEVHADLVHAGHRHIPFASLGDEIAQLTITLNSASKAFNLAGLRAAVCAVENSDLRRRLRALPSNRWTPFSTLGVRASLAAWSDAGETWLAACVQHLRELRDRSIRRVPALCSGIACTEPQAGYLAWLDCRGLALTVEPADFFLEHARVALSPGHEFGLPGHGHARLNFATSEALLEQILERMARACARAMR
jgi:cysteine-S-conjugate beta-lyase